MNKTKVSALGTTHIVAVLIIVFMLFTVYTDTVQAETVTPAVGTITIKSFDPLEPDVKSQNLVRKDPVSQINLPSTLQATDDGDLAMAIAGVTWEPDKTFDNKVPGTYVYTAVLPEGYALAAGTEMPQITVKVMPSVTTISGLALIRKQTAGKKMTDTITVTPALSRAVKLQMWSKSKKKWITKKTFKASSAENGKLTLKYPNSWYSQEKSSWRVYIPAISKAESKTSNKVKVTAKRVYQNPKRYKQIKTAVPVRKSGYTLKRGMSGYKVYKVQKKMGTYYGFAKYNSSTMYAVKRFQKRKGISVTGNVNYKTWKAMGFSEHDWYYLDSYVSPMKVGLASTKKQHIDAMVSNAKRYLGTKYIWCASARPGQGIDCTGLVMQSLYAAGIDPTPLGSHVYAYPKYEFSSRKVWSVLNMKHVSFSSRKRGDIIVYQSGGTVNHVAIYLGGNRIIEALPGGTRINSVYGGGSRSIRGVVRPFV